ncbi:MAG TPA: SDR family oxidoreductase [Burkholderiales bacterium]|nr:SDR family oxidoreductase [Burkholderiales bacterium]
MRKIVLILGATSAIARAAAAEFAEQGFDLYLAGRDAEELTRIAADLTIRYRVKAGWGIFAAESLSDHARFFAQVISSMGEIDGVVLAMGYLGDQSAARDFDAGGAEVILVNFTAAASILSHCVNYLEARRQGFIIGIGSVAGDRGRQSNYTYGAAKGGLALYLQGLRNRLYASGVRVITVKPGFVDTAMTYGMPGLFLVASPQYVGKRIVSALHKSADVIYVPGFWRYLMLVIKLIPETVFKRMKL